MNVSVLTQQQMRTAARVHTGFQLSNDHNLSQYTTWFAYRRFDGSESDFSRV
jgi:hypothetical protein